MPVSFVLAEQAVADTLVQSAAAVDPYVLTTARLWASLAALLGLAGAVVGGLALARSGRRIGDGEKSANMALVSGLIAVVGGAVNLAVADGGPGTGNGVVGGALALLTGLIAMFLGGLALARSRRNAAPVTDRPIG